MRNEQENNYVEPGVTIAGIVFPENLPLADQLRWVDEQLELVNSDPLGPDAWTQNKLLYYRTGLQHELAHQDLPPLFRQWPDLSQTVEPIYDYIPND